MTASAEYSLAQLLELALQARRVLIQDPNDSERVASFDTMFKTLLFLDVPHFEVHEGHAFISDAVDTSMADTATLILAFKTPAGTKRAHMVIEFTTLVGGHLDIIEGPTWDNQSGTKNPIYNRFREAAMTSSVLLEDQAQPGFVASDNVILNPTNVAGGTVLHDLYGFGKKEKFPSDSRDVSEWILKPDTQYAIRFTADGGSNKGQVILNWYEHTDE